MSIDITLEITASINLTSVLIAFLFLWRRGGNPPRGRCRPLACHEEARPRALD